MKNLISAYEKIQDKISELMKPIQEDLNNLEKQKKIYRELIDKKLDQKKLKIKSNSNKTWQISRIVSRRCDYGMFEKIAPKTYSKVVGTKTNLRIVLTKKDD